MHSDGPTSYLGLKLLLALFLVLLNGFFVAAEFAIVKVRATRVEELVRSGARGAKIIQRALRDMNAYLSACQVGITIASLGLGWIGEPVLASWLRPFFQQFTSSEIFTHGVATAVSFGIAFGIITFMHIVVGEMAPKALAVVRPEQVAVWTTRPTLWFYWSLYPAIWLLNSSANWLLKLLGLDVNEMHEPGHTEEELRMILAASHRLGEIDQTELELANRIFEFTSKTSADIMVPRVEITSISSRNSLEENIETAVRSGHTRFPLLGETVDQVLGMVHIKDLLLLKNDKPADIESIRRDILFVPETKPIHEILREFQTRRKHLAVVVNEYGGVAGIVTLEDVLEEIVGEIQDEFDQEQPPIRKLEHGQFDVDGQVALGDLERETGITIQPGDYKTVGGYIMAGLGRVPHLNQQISLGAAQFTVTEMDGHRIARVRVQPIEDSVEELGGKAERE